MIVRGAREIGGHRRRTAAGRGFQVLRLGVLVALALRIDEARAAPANLEALWHDACLWEVGSNKEKVPAARAALVAEGERALDYLVPARLDTKDTLVTRALTVVLM